MDCSVNDIQLSESVHLTFSTDKPPSHLLQLKSSYLPAAGFTHLFQCHIGSVSGAKA